MAPCKFMYRPARRWWVLMPIVLIRSWPARASTLARKGSIRAPESLPGSWLSSLRDLRRSKWLMKTGVALPVPRPRAPPMSPVAMSPPSATADATPNVSRSCPRHTTRAAVKLPMRPLREAPAQAPAGRDAARPAPTSANSVAASACAADRDVPVAGTSAACLRTHHLAQPLPGLAEAEQCSSPAHLPQPLIWHQHILPGACLQAC